MNFYIHQTIQIQYLRVGGVSNSSVLQIGSAGMIKPLSNLYNTGGFTKPAPLPKKQAGVVEELPVTPPFFPLQPPSST